MKQKKIKFLSAFLSVFLCVSLCCSSVFASDVVYNKTFEEMQQKYIEYFGDIDFTNCYYLYFDYESYSAIEVIYNFPITQSLAVLYTPIGTSSFSCETYAKIDGNIVRYSDNISSHRCEFSVSTSKYSYSNRTNYTNAIYAKRTNVPMFSTYEQVVAYFNNGSLDGLVNKDSFIKGPVYDGTLPHVENAYLTYNYVTDKTGEYFKVWLNFDFPDGSDKYIAKVYYQADIDIRIRNLSNDDIKSTVTWYSAPLFYTDITYQSHVCHEFAENDNTSGLLGMCRESDLYQQQNDKKTLFQYLSTSPKKYIFYIQLEDGIHKGDIVRLSIDKNGLTSTDITNIFGNTSGTTTGTTGGQVDIIGGDTSIDDIANGGGTINDSYFVDNTVDKADTSSAWQSITDMFSLDGIAGIISMLGNVFSFIPPPVITILTGSFATVCVIIIIKFVRG